MSGCVKKVSIWQVVHFFGSNQPPPRRTHTRTHSLTLARMPPRKDVTFGVARAPRDTAADGWAFSAGVSLALASEAFARAGDEQRAEQANTLSQQAQRLANITGVATVLKRPRQQPAPPRRAAAAAKRPRQQESVSCSTAAGSSETPAKRGPGRPKGVKNKPEQPTPTKRAKAAPPAGAAAKRPPQMSLAPPKGLESSLGFGVARAWEQTVQLSDSGRPVRRATR